MEALGYLIKNKYLKFALNRQAIEGEFVFLTAADSSHYKTAKQFLDSFFKHENDSNIIFYDLGLTDKESHELKNKFPQLIYHQFNYSQYPDYFDLSKNLGGYAWKPVIFWETLNQYRCKLVWMDAGTLIKEPLDNLKKYICWKGYYWHYSPGTIREWTHEKTLSYLEVPEKFYNYRNLSASVIAVDYKFEGALLVARE